MATIQESFLHGANIDFIEGLYQRYLEDPASVDPSWKELFDLQAGGQPITVDSGPRGSEAISLIQPVAPAGARALASQPDLVSSAVMGLQARVDQTVHSFRLRGHLLAQLDPLNRPRPVSSHFSDLGMVDQSHFTPAELDQLVDSVEVFAEKRVRLRDLLERLRRTYCGTLGVEYMTLQDSARRRWLMPRMEHSENHPRLRPEEQRRLLEKLSYAEGFENFLHTKYLGQKRFALEGGETLIPMLDAMLQASAPLGVEEVIIGMAHRGRLNVLTNIMGKSPDQIFTEFDGPKDASAYMGRGDVKYHMGFSSDYETLSGRNIHLSLAFNPSHLECGEPGRRGPRARQAGSLARRGGRPRAAGAHPRRRGVHRPGRRRRDAEPEPTARLRHRRHDPHRHQQPGRLHHRSRRQPLEHLLHGHRADAGHPHLPRERGRSGDLHPRHPPGHRVPGGLPQRRGHRPRLLPPLGPQRG